MKQVFLYLTVLTLMSLFTLLGLLAVEDLLFMFILLTIGLVLWT